ncbi:glycosyltransferase family 4 protein [Crassaminicella profunda]|uniref:glycosyltransferase family 4 protein n=1 Tax=Crassaminicella profunda TaxID=1286698 RepID=UPI001CA7640B|nr:glycosyltransferase family 4 protein [Crassaminicella profunda]QZY55548.1 glycosyltransferase family 4 protein [Crassaminicella profunda]
MSSIGICGHFGGEQPSSSGQTIKTKTVTNELKEFFGEDKVKCMNTNNWKYKPFNMLLQCFLLIKKCRHIVILPAQNGVKVLIPLFVILNLFFRRKIHYVVIGGWLPEMVKRKRWLYHYLKKINGIYVETHTMKGNLESLELTNIFYMPNFKKIDILNENELKKEFSKPFPLCTFSRVVKEKGIEDAIKAVEHINQLANDVIFTLDIYGQIDTSYKDNFEKILESSNDYINYCGIVNSEQSVKTLRDYFILLFPTYYEGEGFPGTLIDAFSAGVPIVASNWKYNSEIIEEGKTGRIVPPKKVEELVEALQYFVEHSEKLFSMKKYCIIEAEKYSPINALKLFINELKK